MNGAVKPIRTVVVCLAVVWMWTGLALGAEPAPANSTADTPRYLTLNQFDAYLELEAEFEQTRVRTDYGLSRAPLRQRNRAWGFEERIGLQLGGVVLDPSLMTFHGDVAFALTQDRYRERTDTYSWLEDKSGHLFTFDVRADFFAGKPVSGSVYAVRQEDRINRRFQPTLTQRRTEFGTNWVLTHDTFPLEMSYDYRESDRIGNARALDDEHYTERTFHFGGDWIIDEDHKLTYSYEHSRDKREFQGLDQAYETDRDLFRLDHELRFGSDRQHTWRTVMRWQEESGDFARDIFEIGPELTLRHSDNLETRYEYQFNREDYEGLEVDLHRADFQLVHQIYSNLTTTVDVFGLHEKVEDDVSTTQYGGSVDWQYNRKNPYGHFYANLSLAYDTEELYGKAGERIVLDESHTFTDPLPVTLRNRNVVAGSIVVSDTSNRRFFTAGIDYMLLRRQDVTQIVRIPAGRIADGDTILVDYKYQTPRDGQLDTMRVDFGLEQRFDCGLRPYYRFAFRDQDVNYSTGLLRRADRTDHHRFGMDYEYKQFRLGAEYEVYDDTVEPYDAFHANGIWHVLQDGAHTLDATARVSRFWFDGDYDDRNVTLVDLELDHRWRLGAGLATVERVAYRWEDDELDGYVRGWDVTAGLTYEVGELTAELTVEYDRLQLDRSTEDDFGAYLRIRREIPNLLAVR